MGAAWGQVRETCCLLWRWCGRVVARALRWRAFWFLGIWTVALHMRRDRSVQSRGQKLVFRHMSALDIPEKIRKSLLLPVYTEFSGSLPRVLTRLVQYRQRSPIFCSDVFIE